MILKHFYEDSLAQSAYLVGCADTGQAIVIDPNIDIGPYFAAAQAEGLRITAVTETHIHADFVSGAHALASAANATLHVSGEGGPDWQYAFAGEPGVRLLKHGDSIGVGRIRLDVCHTPGHTPEHLMFVVTDTRTTPSALGAFTGDFLFVGDVGRPDLLDTAAGQKGTMKASARRLFRSFRTLDELPDHLVIWPGHGSGSACGKSLSGVPVTSLGYERLTNWALRARDEDSFVSGVLADQPDPPMYFGEMKQVNRSGTPAWNASQPLTDVAADEVASVVAGGELLIDVRSDAGRGTLPGALIVPMGRSFSLLAGSVVPSDVPYFLIAGDERQAGEARRVLALIGRPSAAGWIPDDAIRAYQEHGGRVETIETTREIGAGQTLVDVRTSAEWRSGHIDGAHHVPLARLSERVHELDRNTPLLVYCQAGLRSLVAAATLRRFGFSRVMSLEGGLSGHRSRAAAAVTAGG